MRAAAAALGRDGLEIDGAKALAHLRLHGTNEASGHRAREPERGREALYPGLGSGPRRDEREPARREAAGHRARRRRRACGVPDDRVKWSEDPARSEHHLRDLERVRGRSTRRAVGWGVERGHAEPSPPERLDERCELPGRGAPPVHEQDGRALAAPGVSRDAARVPHPQP